MPHFEAMAVKNFAPSIGNAFAFKKGQCWGVNGVKVLVNGFDAFIAALTCADFQLL